MFLIIFGFNCVRQFLTLCIHTYPAGIWKDWDCSVITLHAPTFSSHLISFNPLRYLMERSMKWEFKGTPVSDSTIWFVRPWVNHLAPDPDVKKKICNICPWEMLWIFLIVTQKKFSCETSLQYLFSQEFDMVSLLWNRWEDSNQLKMISL